MARAMWKGVLRIGEASVAVKLYSAIEPRAVHFRLLHAADLQPVRQQLVNAETGRPVEPERVRKGWEAEPGLFVLVDPEELTALEPEPSRDIEVLRVVPDAAIDRVWYERPYHLGPDGDEEGYAALAAVLADGDRVGVARWVMRKRAYAGALRSDGRHLGLVSLRHAGEVVAASALTPPAGRDLDQRELAMASQLVEMLAGSFEPAAYRDEYREKVLELVARKAEGKVIEMRRARPKPRPDSLTDALAASLAAARKVRRSA